MKRDVGNSRTLRYAGAAAGVFFLLVALGEGQEFKPKASAAHGATAEIKEGDSKAEKRHAISSLLMVLAAGHSHAEIIDGSASVLDIPGGSVRFELNDYIEVNREVCSGDWCKITLRVEVSKDAMEGNHIKPNQILRKYLQDVPIGKTVSSVLLAHPTEHIQGKVGGLVFGTTQKKNFRAMEIDVKKLFDLAPDYYVSAEFVDDERTRYLTGRGGDNRGQIFSEFEIREEGSTRVFKAGNFHEVLLQFVIDRQGVVKGKTCVERFCIRKIVPLDMKTFDLDVSGKSQTFISTRGLQRIEDAEEAPGKR